MTLLALCVLAAGPSGAEIRELVAEQRAWTVVAGNPSPAWLAEASQAALYARLAKPADRWRFEPDGPARVEAEKREDEETARTLRRFMDEQPRFDPVPTARAVRLAYERAERTEESSDQDRRLILARRSGDPVVAAILAASGPPRLPLDQPVRFAVPAVRGHLPLPAALLANLRVYEDELAARPPALGQYSSAYNSYSGPYRNLRPETRTDGIVLSVTRSASMVQIVGLTVDGTGDLRAFHWRTLPLAELPIPEEVRKLRRAKGSPEGQQELERWLPRSLGRGDWTPARTEPPYAPRELLGTGWMQRRVDALFAMVSEGLDAPIVAALNDAALAPLFERGATELPLGLLLARMSASGRLEWRRVGEGWIVRPRAPTDLQTRALPRREVDQALARLAGGGTFHAFQLEIAPAMGEREMNSAMIALLRHVNAERGGMDVRRMPAPEQRALWMMLAAVRPASERDRAGRWERPYRTLPPAVRQEFERFLGSTPFARAADNRDVWSLRLGRGLPGATVELKANLQWDVRFLEDPADALAGRGWPYLTIEVAGIAWDAVQRRGTTLEKLYPGRYLVSQEQFLELSVVSPEGDRRTFYWHGPRRDVARGTFAELPEEVRKEIEEEFKKLPPPGSPD